MPIPQKLNAVLSGVFVQTIKVNVPQALRAKLQAYQNDQDIAEPEKAMIAALEDYFQSWVPTKKAPLLPAMYDAEDGPCEVIESFKG
ncbi:MAG: hypothetical protein ABG776_21580 [Cyanobacteria bacterium J06555_13]